MPNCVCGHAADSHHCGERIGKMGSGDWCTCAAYRETVKWIQIPLPPSDWDNCNLCGYEECRCGMPKAGSGDAVKEAAQGSRSSSTATVPSTPAPNAPAVEQFEQAMTRAEECLNNLQYETQRIDVTDPDAARYLAALAPDYNAMRSSLTALRDLYRAARGKQETETVRGTVRHNWQFEAGRHTLSIDVYNGPDWPKGAVVAVSLAAADSLKAQGTQ